MQPLVESRVRLFQLIVALVLIAAFGLPVAWMVRSWLEAREQQRVEALIERLGGEVTWNGDWIGFRWPGGGRIVSVTLANTQVTDGQLHGLASLPGLVNLRLEGTPVTDAGLAHMKTLGQLAILDLCNTRITDDGLRYFKSMTRLWSVDLAQSQVTDAGVAHLKTLTEMEFLDLSHTRITDAAIARLLAMDKLRMLNLEATEITDEGLIQLAKQTRPDALVRLSDTKVTRAGITRLEELAPNWHPTGLTD